MNRRNWYWFLFFGLLVGSGCESFFPEGPAPEDALAGPLEDMSNSQIKLHFIGDEEFSRVFAVSDGLGPIFVNTSCLISFVSDIQLYDPG